MTRVGKNSVGDFLGLAQALQSERDLAAINLLAADLEYVGDSLVPENESGHYNEFVRKQFEANGNSLGWDVRSGDSDEQKASSRQPACRSSVAPAIPRRLPRRENWCSAISTTPHL